ncbi:hypothetical protein QVA66_00110 [Staphylococcus chromogenes]|nr:hypothetical protein [Staphylococcus chromogenes]
MVSASFEASTEVRAPRSTARTLGAVGVLAAVVAAVAGCAAVSNAETASPHAHRSGGSIFSSVAGLTTSEVTSAFPSSTTSQVVRADAQAFADGKTAGNLAALSPNAQWSVDVKDALQGLRLAPLFGDDDIAPIQIGDVMVVGLNSSVLNAAGTAAFSMRDGSLLWQDRSLECQRVDLGGALPCRQNNGAWAPFNPGTGVFGDAINPGFIPETFGFADGVLYSARTTGAGELQVAAGTVDKPASAWTTTVARSAEASMPGKGAEITVGERIDVRLGAAEIELTKAGQPLTNEAHAATDHLVRDIDGVAVNRALSIQEQAGDVLVVNTADDKLVGVKDGIVLWSVNARVAHKSTVNDGKSITFVAGTDHGNVITTVSAADGTILDQRSIVAEAAMPKAIQSAAHGIFHVDSQFSKIAYYSA